MTTLQQPAENLAWYALSPEAAAGQMGVDPGAGLDAHEAARRLEEYGPNELAAEPPPSLWAVAWGQLVNPMNIMLLIVVAASFAIVQIATAVVVLGLVTFNVVMGTAQELKARASVQALAKLQVPHARVRRAGQVKQIESTTLVPGDIVLLEAGDVVPADGRIESSATLEVQEAALTGESAPIAKDAGTLPGDEVALGDRTNLVFQNTQVTRGTATIVVTGTGSATEMGKIAGMVTATQRSKSPLQRELDGMTKVFGLIAFVAVAIIAIFGLVRGQDTTHAGAVVHFDRDRGDPDRAAHVRTGHAVVGGAAAGRAQGGGQVAERRGDPGRDHRHQQRQDRHADDERDDRDHHAGRR